MFRRAFAIILAVSPLTLAPLPAEELKSPTPKSRRFTFSYGATINGLKEGQVARVWLPLPPQNDEQQVALKKQQLPAEARRGRESRHGNELLYFEAKVAADGVLTLSLEYEVTRHEIRRRLGKGDPMPLSNLERKLALTPDRLGPITGKPLELLQGLELPRDRMDLARVLYNRVDEHVKYDKSQSGYGKGDVLWVCDSRFGNCCDFHSLFMALARSQGVPARFEIGFPIPDERGRGKVGGYHCWAFFHDDARGWVPVDISEADKHPNLKEYYFGSLTENRVTFSRGRDLVLDPPQRGPPLNYLIYPYVETAGRPLAAEHVQVNFTYADAK